MNLLREKDESVAQLVDKALPLEGLVRNLGMHAGGVLIAPGKLTDFCPLYSQDENPDNVISQFDKKDVENVGLVKFDFLGLTTLTILEFAMRFIRLSVSWILIQRCVWKRSRLMTRKRITFSKWATRVPCFNLKVMA